MREAATAPSAELERDAIRLVTSRLAQRFPAAGRGRIETLVDRAYHEFDHRHVRTFVPVLVEHEVYDELLTAR